MQILWVAFLLLISRTCEGDPWGQCPTSRQCKGKFADGSCDKECLEPECLRDGFDCQTDRGSCNPGHIQYCRDHYANLHCEQGCDSAACGWDGSDCFRRQSPQWAKGTLLLHVRVSQQHVTLSNSSLLWALSVLLRSPVKLRGTAPLAPNRDLLTFDPQQLTDLLAESSTKDPNSSVLFLQVDNRPCSNVPLTCFNHATEAANLLHAMLLLKSASLPSLPELKAIIRVRGVREEIGVREEEKVEEESKGTPTWLWSVIGVATGLALALALAVVLVIRRVRRQQGEREGGERVRHRSTVTDNNGAKVWAQHIPHRDQRLRSEREKERNGIKKKKKAKEAEKKRRREPLGEDAIRMRPLKREADIGSDTDFTQSSMEDINARSSRRQEDSSICDHRTQEQKHYRQGHSQTPRPSQAPPRGWERSAIPPLLSPPQQTAPVQWCGPDGSVVLIRAVRSGLDRVVLELLRAGVPVNNTDHTGRSALHWACSVNHLSLTRTLTRYGAVVDLQDNKGETPLFLSALHGCYDTARFLLLNGANQDLHDRRGRRPIDVAREGLHHQVLELLLAHRVQRGPVPIEPANDMLWEERALMYSPWVASPALPGRSSSFSGVIGHRDMTPPPQSDWSIGRVQCPSPQNWRPQLNQSATALVPPRVMGRSPRPISTLQEVTSEAEDEDRDRQQDIPRAATPHFLSPQPAPRQRSFSCTQNALQRRSSTNQTEPTYVVVTDKVANEPTERVIVVPPTDPHIQSDRRSIVDHSFDNHSRVESVTTSSEQKPRVERLNNNTANSTQTAL